MKDAHIMEILIFIAPTVLFAVMSFARIVIDTVKKDEEEK